MIPPPQPDAPPRLMMIAPEGLSVVERDLFLARLERRSPLIELPPGASLFQLVDGRWELLATLRRSN